MDNTDIILENSIATWRMPPTIGDLGGTYTGVFMFRTFLDPLRQLQAGREYREQLGPHAIFATDTEGQLAYGLTQLKHRIIKAPPFWTSSVSDSGMAGNIGDLNIIMLVLDAASRAEAMHKDKIRKEREVLLERSIKSAEAKLQAESEEQMRDSQE